MEKEILQQHLNSILDNSASVINVVKPMDYEQFVKEEQTKETVYSYLQEIGQTAYEIDQSTDQRLDLEFDMGVLSNFKNARYNQEIEMDHHSVWSIIKNDLPDITDQIRESREYNSTGDSL